MAKAAIAVGHAENGHKRNGAAGKRFWRVLGSFAGWQTACLNLHKKTMPRLANGMELQGCVLRVLAGFGEFCGLASGRLEPAKEDNAAAGMHKRTRPWLANGMELQGSVLGVLGGFAELCGLANDRLEPA